MNLQSDLILDKAQKSGLYIVSTPIGNLKDITLRAIEVLRSSDYILCEDTRVSKKLLNHYGIKSNLISNHKFNEKKNIDKIISILKSKKIVSLISDAGTPTVSDPGNILIKECIKEKINLVTIPGPSASLAAFSLSGFSDKFFFYGFVPESNKKINEDLKKLNEYDFSIIFFISSKKLNKFIGIFQKYFFDREVLICKEITKFYEEYFRFKVKELNVKDLNLKGEVTLVFSEKKLSKSINIELEDKEKKIIKKLIHKLTIKEIVEIIKNSKDIPKRDIYNYCLMLKNEK